MPVFLTGSTGYIGGYIASELLEAHGQRLNLLVRADNEDAAAVRLWQSLQLHLDFKTFAAHLGERIQLFCGDLTRPRFGLDDDAYRRLVTSSESVIHCAAALNRKSEKVCLNVNLRGTLEMIKLAQAAHVDHGLRRISHVSTVAVAGERSNEVVTEDKSIDWGRSDYDPYARTKKFCEHMIRELLPDVPRTIFRPSIVLGDSRRPETTQFEMVQAFAFLASLPLLPFRPDDKIDIVPVDYVASTVAQIHETATPAYDCYHLSSGTGSQTFRELTTALAKARDKRGPAFAPWLGRPFNWSVHRAAAFKSLGIGRTATLMKVFLPYLVWNTVFDNTRVVAETGRAPAPFSDYCFPLLRFSQKHAFKYPHQPWPADTAIPSASLKGTAV